MFFSVQGKGIGMLFFYYIVFIMKLPFEGMFFIMGCIMELPFVVSLSLGNWDEMHMMPCVEFKS